MIAKRYLYRQMAEDLPQKMVLLGGPRQVGKTTLARQIGKNAYQRPLYLNWDDGDDQGVIHDRTFNEEADLIIFDELHKYEPWKSYLKGLYDKRHNDFDILVTGSARLDIYRKGGDSLQGRYHYFRLHPFSVAEALEYQSTLNIGKMIRFPDRSARSREAFETLLEFGGFPEPFFKQNARTLRRWQKERVDRLIREDIRDIETIHHLSTIQLLVNMLPERVSSLFSINSVREALRVSHNTVAAWMEILERFYYLFRVPPFATTIVKSLRKEPKLYFWDWSEIQDPAARLENMVASHLLKWTHFISDTEGYRMELYFLRDTFGREVDFLVTVNRKPWFAVEVKLSDTSPAKTIRYFGDRLKIPYLFQVVGAPGLDIKKNGIRIMSADKFLGGLV